MALPFTFIEDVPEHLQSQPELDPLFCYECIRRYGNAFMPGNSADRLVPRQACSTTRNAAGQCDKCISQSTKCSRAKDKIPPQFRRATNMLLEMRKTLDQQSDGLHPRSEAHMQRQMDFARRFAQYGCNLNRAMDAHAQDRAAVVAEHGEAALRRDDERRLRIYLHNFERAMLGIGPIGDPEPTNVVVDREIELQFLLSSSEEEVRNKYYGAQTTLPIRGFHSRSEREDSMQR